MSQAGKGAKLIADVGRVYVKAGNAEPRPEQPESTRQLLAEAPGFVSPRYPQSPGQLRENTSASPTVLDAYYVSQADHRHILIQSNMAAVPAQAERQKPKRTSNA